LYKIFETTNFIKKVKKVFKNNLADALFRKLQSDIYPQLKHDPYYGSNIKKLRNYKPETWRYRIGDYRLFFSIDEECQTIFILDIDHRKDAY
jgi:mRNA interferase RelE/StbE